VTQDVVELLEDAADVALGEVGVAADEGEPER
jgi:hypothetical protein